LDRKLKVGVLFGGRSGEHEVSLSSAASVMKTMEGERYKVVPIGITREGRFVLSGDPLETLRAGSTEGVGIGEAAKLISTLDVVFPVLHGPYGEDGTLQGFLELLNVPYVGAGVLASALGMDKAAMKQAFQACGLPVVEHFVLSRRDWEKKREELIAHVERVLGYPCFIKPANLGSSVGVSKAKDRDGLIQAMTLAAQYDRKLLAEKALDCREVEVGVLGNDDPIASVPGEVVPKREWYDYEAKYRIGMSEILIPAPLSQEQAEELRRLAVEAFKAIDCAGMARVDFFLDRETRRIVVSEINTIPGFTATSGYARMWEATGLSYAALIQELVDLALERHRDRGGSVTAR